MKIKNFWIIFLAGLFLSSCSNMDKMIKEMLVDVTPEQKEMILKKAQKIQFKKTLQLSKSGMDRVKLKKGQWVTTLTEMKNESNDVVLTTTKVVAISGNTVVLETETYTASENGIGYLSQVTYKNLSPSAKLSYSQAEYDQINNKLVVKQMLTKSGDEPVQKMPQQYLDLQKSVGGKSLGAVNIGETIKTKCGTPYIKSSRCITYKMNATTLGKDVVSTVYAHSKIPISGIVKIESDDMDVTTIAYGYSGAKQKIFYKK